MRRRATILVVVFLLGSLPLPAEVARRELGQLVMEGIPEIPAEVAERTLQYQAARAAQVVGWAADGNGLFITTRFGETSQVHFVAVPGGARRQLTFFREPVGQVAVCPDPSSGLFLYARDVGGGEFYQLFFFDLATASSTLVTDGRSRNSGAVWNRAGTTFAYSSTRRNGKDTDVYLASRSNPLEARPIITAGGSWGAGEFSPDGKRLLVVRAVSANESYPFVYELESSTLTPLHTAKEPVAYGAATWAADSRHIYFTSDEGSEFKHLRLLDTAKGKVEVLTADIPWDVEGIELSHDGRTLAFTVNEDGISALYLMDTATRARRRVADLPAGQVWGLRFHPRRAQLAMTINGSRTPGDVYVLDLEKGELVRWTYSEVGGLDTTRFVEPTLIRYPTFDRVGEAFRQIPAFYYRPSGPGPFPVLITIHGGPEAQFTPTFNPLLQYYVNELGIAVLAPNVRGSSGYGKTYLTLDNGYRREDAVKDIGALLDWITQQKELDASRVAVIGGSYGGYMVLASLVHFNDRLRCGIDIVGISNFVTFLTNTQDYRRDLRRVEYGDERDPDMRAFLERISPLTNAHRITKPLFVVQGLNDPRVPASESEQMVRTVRANGGQVWYLLAKDEGHGFRKHTNRTFYENAVVLFLQEFLLK
jgi:dipeptidyl aminopeptidase/acylaminoacyl peptidase